MTGSGYDVDAAGFSVVSAKEGLLFSFCCFFFCVAVLSLPRLSVRIPLPPKCMGANSCRAPWLMEDGIPSIRARLSFGGGLKPSRKRVSVGCHDSRVATAG